MSALVSVIIPVYNMESFLPETLQSVLASTYDNLEIVVVDDGSSDASVSVAQTFAQRDDRVRVLTQPNAGPCRARNRGIEAARGEYIFPLDADDLLAPDFLRQAVAVLQRDAEVKIVCPTIEFMGDRQGLWRLPEFSLPLLARRNHIAACALYRRADWQRVGGYCESLIAREDWDFWIAMLKDGGRVVRLPEVGYWYRVRKGSKRFRDRRHNAHVLRMLNARHAAFFAEHLGGPLRRMRSWSRFINAVTRPFRYHRSQVAEGFDALRRFVHQLPYNFEQQGTLIFKNRNAIKSFDVGGAEVVVKEFCLPHTFNRFAYRWLRGSKAERSFRHAQTLRSIGVSTPEPIGFCEVGNALFVGRTYYVTRRSALPHDFHTLRSMSLAEARPVLVAIAQTTAKMHEHGLWHKDYSGNNVLWGHMPEGIAIELIDLNRMRIGAVSPELGALNFAALRPSPEFCQALIEAYAQARQCDPAPCLAALTEHLAQHPET